MDLIFTDLNTTNTKIDIKKLTTKPICVIIGPEGDFSDSEYSKISDAGFLSITLGKYVLKCETAAIKAISLLQYEFARMAC